MADSDSGSAGCGCGCVSIVVFILVVWSLVSWVQTPWGSYHISLFPPSIECHGCRR